MGASVNFDAAKVGMPPTWFTVATMVGNVAAPNFQIDRGGDITMLADKKVDCATNGGELHPARVSQSAQPTPTAYELQVHHDSDDDKTYLVYNDPTVGVRQVEMT